MIQTTTTINLPPQQLAIVPFKQNIIIPPSITPSPKPEDACINPSFCRRLFSGITEEFYEQYTTEKLLKTTFYWIMTTTSFSHLILGFELMEKTGLSQSMSPIAMYLFKYSLAIFTSIAVACTDVHRQTFKTPIRKNTRLISTGLCLPLAHFISPFEEKYKRIIFYISDVSFMSCMGGFSNGFGNHEWLVDFGLYWFVQTVVFPIGVRANLSSDLVLVTSIFTTFQAVASSDIELVTSSAHSIFCFIDKSILNLLPIVKTRVKSTLKERKMGKLIKYAIGLMGTLLFQNFFRLTTFGHVKAFMYLATSWLANLALTKACEDFGILNFILGNMILGSTVSQSGLGIITWFTYGVCLFLYILGIKLKSMNLSQNIDNLPNPPFVFWIFYCCAVFDYVFSVYHQM